MYDIEGEEVKDTGTLARVQTVEEMLPKPAGNQITKGNAAKIGEEQYKIIEECFKMDSTIEEACILAGISVPAYYDHLKKNPEFAHRIKLAKQFPKMIARAAVQKRIRLGDIKVAMKYLELRDKRYREDYRENMEEDDALVVQFTSVPSEEGQNTTNHDSQTNTKQNLSSEGYSNTSQSNERLTPRENEQQALKNLDSLDFRSE